MTMCCDVWKVARQGKHTWTLLPILTTLEQQGQWWNGTVQLRHNQVYLIQFILATSYIPCRAHIRMPKWSYGELQLFCNCRKNWRKKTSGFYCPPECWRWCLNVCTVRQGWPSWPYLRCEPHSSSFSRTTLLVKYNIIGRTSSCKSLKFSDGKTVRLAI